MLSTLINLQVDLAQLGSSALGVSHAVRDGGMSWIIQDDSTHLSQAGLARR